MVSHNTASVSVTRSELIIASAAPIGDLNHRAPRAHCEGARGSGLGFERTAVTVEFDAEAGGRRTVELALRDPNGFIAALGARA